MPTICLRYFNIYGPRQDPKSQYATVIPISITRTQQNRPIVIYGDGKQTRDFTFIQDAVNANILAAESDATGVLNIGTGSNTSINHLAETILKTMGKKLAPVYQSPRAGDVLDSLADISKARTIGYHPDYNLERGLQETIEWFTGNQADG